MSELSEKPVLAEKFIIASASHNAMSFAVVALFFARCILVVPFWRGECRESVVVSVLRTLGQRGRVGGRFLVPRRFRFVG